MKEEFKEYANDSNLVKFDGGSRYWVNSKGDLHRKVGPAIDDAEYYGMRGWYYNGQRHREDGPAIEYEDGTRLWYRNGALHREDGPAIEYADGRKLWYIGGAKLRDGEISLLVDSIRSNSPRP